MLSIVIPAYNEEKRILRTLEAYAKDFPAPFEICIVANGCTDKTVEIVRSFIEKTPQANIRLTEIKEAVGKGGALRAGFKEVTGEIVGFVDADLATPVAEVVRLVDITREEKVDGVIASRLLPDAVVHGRGLMRGLASRVFAFLVRSLTDLEYQDTQCGAKFFTRDAMRHILPDLTMSDMTIDVDMLLASEKHNLHIIESPSEWYDRADSAQLGSPLGLLKSGMKMFFSLIKLQRKYENYGK